MGTLIFVVVFMSVYFAVTWGVQKRVPAKGEEKRRGLVRQSLGFNLGLIFGYAVHIQKEALVYYGYQDRLEMVVFPWSTHLFGLIVLGGLVALNLKEILNR